MSIESSNIIQEGLAALRAGDWQTAREVYGRALRTAESPQALEGLALAAWWQDDRAAAIDAREQSYRLYRESGDARSAARMALWLSVDYSAFRGEPAISNGWLERARRLLQDAEPCEEQCWALCRVALRTLRAERNTEGALAVAREAATLARSLGCTDMEMLARSFEGVTLIDRGDVGEGMQRLDEVSAAVLAGEVSQRWVIALACCNLLSGCGRVRDFERASEWSTRLKDWGQRWKHPPVFAACRTLYSEVLVSRGQWGDAEAELSHAIAECEKLGMSLKAEAVIRLAELRRRQGRLEEARTLALQAELHPGSALVRAELALDEGRPSEASELADRYLRRANPENCTELGAGLELLVRAQIAASQAEKAAEGIARLESVCSRMSLKPALASCKYVKGLFEVMSGHPDAARQHFEDATDIYHELGAPFESARVGIELAATLMTLDRRDLAREQARRALDALVAIGATKEAARARALLEAAPRAEPSRGGGTETPSGLTGLTPREQQILRLIAQGKTNIEIAKQLFLSEHTVHRHVSNILTKLDLSSRAAAVAFASARGLL